MLMVCFGAQKYRKVFSLHYYIVNCYDFLRKDILPPAPLSVAPYCCIGCSLLLYRLLSVVVSVIVHSLEEARLLETPPENEGTE